MKKITAAMIVPFLFLACSTVQKTKPEKDPSVVSSPEIMMHSPAVKEGWALYSHGLNIKRLALKNRKNPDKKKMLKGAVFYFNEAAKGGEGLEYIYNQLSDSYYHLYQFTRAIEYAELSIKENNLYRPPYFRLYSIFMRLRNKKKAADVLHRYLKVKPDALQIRYVLARNYYLHLKNLSRAEEEFNRLIQIARRAQNGAYYVEYGNYYLGDMAYRRGLKKKAIKYYENTVSYNQRNNFAHYRLALLHLEALHFQKARMHAVKYLKVYPGNRTMRGVVGRIHYINRESGAISSLRRATGRNVNGILARGLLLEMEGKDKPAEKILRFVVKRKPTALSAYLGLAAIEKRKKIEKAGFNELVTAGILAFRNRAYPLARRYFSEALRIDDSVVEAHYYMGRTCEEEGNRTLAIHYYLQVNEKKTSSDLMLHIGYLFGQDKKYDRAFELFDRVTSREPQNAKPYFYRGLFEMQDKKYNAAEKNIRKAISLDDARDSYYFYLAVVLEKKKKIREAIDYLEKALKKNPESAKINNFLGYLYADQDMRLERSLALIKKALAIDPGNGAYLDSLGWAYYRQGKYDLALKMLLEAEQRLNKTKSQDPVVYDHIGDAYLKQNNRDKALLYWGKSLKLEENKKIRKKVNNYQGK